MLTLSRHEESRAAADSASNAGLGHSRRRRPGRPRRNERRNSDQQPPQERQGSQQHQLAQASHLQPSHAHAAGASDLHDLLELDASDAAAAAAASLLLNEVFQTEMSPPSSSALRALYAGLEEEDCTLDRGCDSHDDVEDLGFFLGFLDDGGGTSDDDEYLWGAADEALDLDALEPTMLNDGSFVLINADGPDGEVRHGGSHASRTGASARADPDATAAPDFAPATLNVHHHVTTAVTSTAAPDDDGRHSPDVPPLATSILPVQRQHPRPISPQSVAQRAVRLASGKNRGPQASSVSSGGKTGWIPLLASLSDSGSEAEPPAISDVGPSVPPSPAIKPGVPASHLVTASTLPRAAGALAGADTRVSLALDAELEDTAFAMPSSVKASLSWEQDADADVDVDLVLLAADDSDVEFDLDGTQDGCEPAQLSPNWSESGEPSLFIHRRASDAGLLPSPVDIAGSATTLEDLQETLLAALGNNVEVNQRRFLLFEEPEVASGAGELVRAAPDDTDAAFAVAITHPLQLVPGALRDDDTEAAALKDTTEGPTALVLDRALNANARNGGARSWLNERDNRMAACASPPPPLLCVRCPPVGSGRASDGYLRFRPQARLPTGADALVRSLWTRRPLRSEAAASSAAVHAVASAGALHIEGAFCKEKMRRRRRGERSKWRALCDVAEFASEGSTDDDNDDEDSDDCESSQGDALGGSYLVGIFDSEDDLSDPELVTFYALSHVRRKRRHRGGPRRAGQRDEDSDLSKPDAKRAKQAAIPSPAAGPSAPSQTSSMSVRAGSPLVKGDGAGGSSAAAAAAAAALAGLAPGQTTPVTPMQKRAMHNVLERKRREDLRASYRALRSSIPELASNERASASVILHAASAYIAKLKQEDAYIVAQLRQLRGPAAAPTPTASETYGVYASSHGRDGMTPTPRAQATPPATFSRVQPVRFPGYT